MPSGARSGAGTRSSTRGGVIEIPLPLLLLPFVAAGLLWIGFPWLARRVERPDLLRWLPPGLIVVGGALLWLSATDAPAGGHDGRATSFAATAVALCDATRALPDDREAAVRAFQDRAHEPLHVLAADATLDRTLAADLLRAKERVEAGIAAGATGAELEGAMDALAASTGTALADIGIEVEPCGG
jgi:hypothetical protein